MKYATPQALRSALAAHARRAARDAGVPSDELILRFYLGRLLARVFRANPDGWLLKGGQALLVRYPDARHSRDIDLCGTTTTSLDEAVAALERAAALDLQDHLRFSLRSRDDRLEGNGTTRLRFDVQLGGRVIPNGISVDVVVGRHPIGQPTRNRDLVDLILIALREPLDGRQLHLALHAEVARRTARGTHLRIPVTFTIPGPAWPAGYRAAAAAVAGLVDYRTIEPAGVLARTLLDPLLGEDNPPAHWDPDQLRWR